MSTPLASFLITALNAEQTIVETIDSLHRCGIDDFEVILVDDGSTDKTVELSQIALSCYNHKIISLRENIGTAAAANFGISIASGNYIARIDADDLCEVNRLALQIKHLEQNCEVAFCGGALRHFGAATGGHVYPTGISQCVGTLPAYCCFGHPSVTFDRSRLKQQFYYDPKFAVAHDYHLWSRLIPQGIFGDNIPELCTSYRIHDRQLTSTRKSTLIADDFSIKQQLLANMLLPDRFMSSVVFSLYLMTRFENQRPDFISAMLDMVEMARPIQSFTSAWAVTKSWLTRTLIGKDTSSVPQSSMMELSQFALRQYGHTTRLNK